jgi:hypothetical protein
MNRVWAFVFMALLFGLFAEGLGVVFESEGFSITAALGIGALFASFMTLWEWSEANVKRLWARFLMLTLGFTLLLVVIAPVGRGEQIDPIPILFLAVGIPALFVALDRPFKRWERWAEDQRRRHPSSSG